MARASAQAKSCVTVTEGAADLADRTEELKSRLVDGMGRLAGRANRSAQRFVGAAQELRSPVALRHAIAARERGNLEAAFWLFGEEFGRRPDDPSVALSYWDVALSFGRGDIASPAGVKLVETRAAEGETELAAQHWIELVKEAPDALVSPIAIATILPALKERLAGASDDGPDNREALAGYLRTAVRHAVDPRNSGLHPGVALRIFQEGQGINPEASRRAAEIALESPHLHEAKRDRLIQWLSGSPDAAPISELNQPAQPTAPEPDRARGEVRGLSEPNQPAQPTAPEPDRARGEVRGLSEPNQPAQPTAPEPDRARGEVRGLSELNQPARPTAPESDRARGEVCGLSEEEIAKAAARLRQATTASPAPTVAAASTGPRIACGTLIGLDEDALAVQGAPNGRLRYDDIQAVSVVEIMDLEGQTVTVIDLILNWIRRNDEPLEIVRLRKSELDYANLVAGKHSVGSDFAALMSEILERTSAIPLPDPESALGTRITCFENSERYVRGGLRVPDRAA